jgi:hypothetical protein
LSQGIYTVAVSIGRSRQTLMEEGADEISQILQAQPQLMPLIGPLYFKYRDFPGAKEIADLMRKVREKQFPGLESDDEQGPTQEQLQAQVQGQQQQMQQMQQALQMAIQKLETEQAKQQAMLIKAQMDNQTRLEVEKIKAENATTIQELKAQLDALKAVLEHGREYDKMAHESAHDVAMAHVNTGNAMAQGVAGSPAPAAPKTADLEFKQSATQPLDVPVLTPPGGAEV